MAANEDRTAGDVTCPHCGNVAPMTRFERHSASDVLTDVDNQPIADATTTTEALICRKRRKLILREWVEAPWTGPEDDWTTVFPVPSRIESYLPAKIRSAYRTANAVSNVRSVARPSLGTRLRGQAGRGGQSCKQDQAVRSSRLYPGPTRQGFRCTAKTAKYRCSC